MTVKQKAKAQAIRDIKKELRAHNQTFMAFIKELNPVMDKLVEEQLEGQEKQGPKFKKGDKISCVIPNSGLENATVLKVEGEKYVCKISNGIAYIPCNREVEANYELVED